MNEPEAEYLTLNRANWDDRAVAHAEHGGYDLQVFRDDPAHLSDVVRFDRPRLGDLSRAPRRAPAVPPRHRHAVAGSAGRPDERRRPERRGRWSTPPRWPPTPAPTSTTTWPTSTTRSRPSTAREGAYDFVYTGIGALCWLPSIERWADVVTRLLKPGGRLHLREGHPMCWSLGDPREDGLVAVEFPYFERPEPLDFDEDITYVDIGDHRIEHGRTQEWNHGLGEVVTALMSRGMSLTRLEEHPTAPWAFLGRPVRRAPRAARRVLAGRPAVAGRGDVHAPGCQDRLIRAARPVGRLCPSPARAGVRLDRACHPIRIGIDTGGTFTDVVAFDESDGTVTTTKTPSTPADPAEGFMAGIDKVLGPGRRRRTTTSPPSRTAPPWRPTSCSRARSTRSATSRTPATRRCSRSPGSRCPTATATPTSGSSRPASCRGTWCAASRAGSTTPAPSCGPSTRTAPARSRAGSASRASTPSGSASCTPTPTPSTRSGCARSCARSTPTRSCR